MLAVGTAIVLMLPLGTASTADPPTPPIKVMIVGDSIAQGQFSTDGRGVQTELSRLLNEQGVNHVYTNSGSARPGSTIQYTNTHILTWLNADQPDVVVLLTGTNNAAGSCFDESPCVGMTNFGTTYQSVLQKILSWSLSVKLVTGTVPYSNAPWSPNQVWINVDIILKTWGISGTGALGAGRTALAYTNKLHWCELFDTTLGGIHVHPRDGGYRILAKLFATALLPLLGKLAPTINEVLTDKRPYNNERGATMPC